MMKEYRSPWRDEELDLFRSSIQRFIERDVAPNEARWREQKHVDRELWRKAGQAGFLCTDIPAIYGGVGGDFRHEVVLLPW